MMGTQGRDFVPQSAISLEDLVPADSFYRRLEATLDLSFVARSGSSHLRAHVVGLQSTQSSSSSCN